MTEAANPITEALKQRENEDMLRELRHIVRLMTPNLAATKSYFWHKANAMARECPAMYASLPDALTRQINSVLSESGLVQPPTKE